MQKKKKTEREVKLKPVLFGCEFTEITCLASTCTIDFVFVCLFSFLIPQFGHIQLIAMTWQRTTARISKCKDNVFKNYFVTSFVGSLNNQRSIVYQHHMLDDVHCIFALEFDS